MKFNITQKHLCFFKKCTLFHCPKIFQAKICSLKMAPFVNFKQGFSTAPIYCRKKSPIGKPQYTEEQLFMKFCDEKRLILQAGKGGDGRSAFLRDKNTAFGGPNGGNGGRGGDVVLVSDQNVKNFENIKPFYFAESGKDGGCHDLYGRDGEGLNIELPIGTLVRCRETHEIIADFTKHGQSCLICAGGSGGKGNRFFVDSVNTTPEECTPGLPGEKMVVLIELRTLAHAGLVGYPNAGKSTLLRAFSRAMPAVSPYAFTTLVPHLGVLHFEDFTQILIADTPGIIDGAHRNEGLGIRFLKHIERCRFILYVIDMSSDHPFDQLENLMFEMEQYDESLITRPGMILANKIDLPESVENYTQFHDTVKALELPFDIMPVSGKECDYLEEIIPKIRTLYDNDIKERKRYGKTIPLEW